MTDIDDKHPKIKGQQTQEVSIVLVDDHQKRQDERKTFHLRSQELEQATKLLRRFEEVDKPEFNLWLETEFSELIIARRAALHKLFELTGMNREHQKHPPKEKDLPNKEEHFTEQYLKSIYRQLVRMLHPDTVVEPTSKSQDLWHEVQSAYRWRDLQRLEGILAKLSGKHPQSTDLNIIPISHIMELSRDIERRLLDLKSRIARSEREKHWNFHTTRRNKHHMQTLTKTIRFELESDLQRINAEIARLERQISRKDSPTRRARRR